MEARQLVCPDCGTSLDARRVSCPSCGRSLGERTVFGIDAARARDLTSATRHRLDELADGWELPAKAEPAPAPEEGRSGEVTRRAEPVPDSEKAAARPAPAFAPDIPAPAASAFTSNVSPSLHEDPTRTVMELPPFAQGRPPAGVAGALLYTARALRAAIKRRLQLRRLRAAAAEKERGRDERLSELGEVALAVPELQSAALDAARPHIASLDDAIEAAEKDRGATIAAVANEERQAGEAARGQAEETRTLQARMDELDTRIRPLANDQKSAEKAVYEAELTIGESGRRLSQLEARRNAADARGESDQADVGAVSAQIATVLAERESAERTLPVLREKLSSLAPSIDGLRIEWEAARGSLEHSQKQAAEREVRRKAELKRLSERRAAVEQQLARAQGDRKVALRDLGAKLDWDRVAHPELSPRYRALDELGGALTAIEYQLAELSREAGALDRRAVALAGAVVGLSVLFVSLLVWLLVR